MFRNTVRRYAISLAAAGLVCLGPGTAILATAEVQVKLRTMGVEPDGRPAAQFSEFQQAETVKWAKVIKEAGIQAE
jgi:hypothetical protein